MSTIADYSVFTKTFLASGMTDFSQLYGNKFQDDDESGGTFRAFAVIPFNLDTPLTPREAMNVDLSKLDPTSASGPVSYMARRVSCRDANGQFIGNIVRVQPSQRDGSIRFVAKVAVTDLVVSDDGSNPADASYNTFVLVRTDASTNIDLPIAVATISKGYNLHRHKVVVNSLESPLDDKFSDPLDDVENANYVSFTINHLNGYTSVDFNPDAYATYDDVANALSRGIDGLHIAFDTASGDLKLLDKDGNVLDQANLPIKADVIIADGEEGYKYVKTDVKQDIHAAKAWMPEGSTAWEAVGEVPYTMRHAALVVGNASTTASRVFVGSKGEVSCPISTESVQLNHFVIGGSIYMLGDVDVEGSRGSLFRVKGDAGSPQYNVTTSGGSVTINDASTPDPASYNVTSGSVTVDVVTINDSRYVLGETSNSGDSRYRTLSTEGNGSKFYGSIETSGGSSTGEVLGIALADQEGTKMYTFDEGAQPHAVIKNISGSDVRWLDIKPLPEDPNRTLKYGLEAFVWTVKGAEVTISDPFFNQLNASLLALGFHEGDDIALGTNLATLAPTGGVSPLNKVDADDYIHGKGNKARREREVDEQRKFAKEELVEWNKQHPALTENRQEGTIIDHTGLDVRNGSITLGCGSIGKAGVYGIQMKDRSSDQNIQGRSESLDFTISHTTGNVQFDDNGHAANLASSTLLSIEAGSYISGAPTCLILAEVTRKPKDVSLYPEEGSHDPTEGSPVLTPVRMTAGFSVKQFYDVSNGLTLTIHDYRDNIKAILNPDGHNEMAPSIIEVQAIYTHRNAETVPAQQMHTYIGEWNYNQTPTCSFLCNKIEEWMTAVGLADTAEGVKLYVVIRVY